MTKPGSLMLKDYLLRDELSSCSSNGFGSLPRRQCCATTTIRFLLDIDSSLTNRSFPLRNASRKLAFSTLQRASEAIIKAFKQLPFPSVKNNSDSYGNRARTRKGKGTRKGFFLRSFSRKRRNAVAENGRRSKSFQEFLNEKQQNHPSDQTLSDYSIIAMTGAGRNSISSNNSRSNSWSWTEGEFTTSEMMVSSSSGNSESSSENVSVKGEKESESPGKLIGEIEGVTAAKDSIEEEEEEITKPWRSEEEKEQLSPISILDFHFNDEDRDVFSSNLNSNIHKRNKMKRFEDTNQLEPLNLQKRFSNSNLHHRNHLDLDYSISSLEEHQIEQRAYELLHKLVNKSMSVDHSHSFFIFETQNLLLDFFHEKIEENVDYHYQSSDYQVTPTRFESFEGEILKVTEDWLNGGFGEGMLTECWEFQEMEKSGKWGNVTNQKKDLTWDFENEIWISLLNELMVDLIS